MRHGKKAWDNGKAPLHYKLGSPWDPPLASDSEIYDAIEQIEQQAHQNPGRKIKKIYTSPYLRCRQTAIILAKELGVTDIIVDPDLREFLGNWRKTRVVFDTDTWKYIKGLDVNLETKPQFINRSLSILDKDYWFEDDAIIVTHSFLIDTVLSAVGFPKQDIRPAYMKEIPTESIAFAFVESEVAYSGARTIVGDNGTIINSQSIADALNSCQFLSETFELGSVLHVEMKKYMGKKYVHVMFP